jgi:hypothetical protein
MNRTYPLLLTSLLLCGCGRSAVAVDAAEPVVAKPSAAQPVAQVAQVAQQPAQAEPFRFPADKGGQILSQILRPEATAKGLHGDVPPARRDLKPPTGVAQPETPLAQGPGGLPQRELQRPAPPVRPRMLAEGAPLSGQDPQAPRPSRQALPTGPLAQQSARDPAAPTPLPYIGLILTDRVPLDDPTADLSLRAALAAEPPARATPVPFAPENLPDPFANARTVQLKAPPAESPEPPTASPRVPK